MLVLTKILDKMQLGIYSYLRNYGKSNKDYKIVQEFFRIIN